MFVGNSLSIIPELKYNNADNQYKQYDPVDSGFDLYNL